MSALAAAFGAVVGALLGTLFGASIGVALFVRELHRTDSTRYMNTHVRP